MTVITITYWVWNGYNGLSFGHHSNLNWYIFIEKEEWKGHLAINHKVNADSGHTNPDIHHCPLSRDIHHLKMCRCFHICFLFCPVYRVVYPFVSVERFINLKIGQMNSFSWWYHHSSLQSPPCSFCFAVETMFLFLSQTKITLYIYWKKCINIFLFIQSWFLLNLHFTFYTKNNVAVFWKYFNIFK